MVLSLHNDIDSHYKVVDDCGLTPEPRQSSIEELSKKMDRILERLSLLEGMMTGSPDGEAIAWLQAVGIL